MSSVLLVFAKVPRPGEVKTRLTPVLTSEEAAQLYDAFLHDALDLYSELAVDVRLYLAPPLPDEGLDGIPEQITVCEQAGDGLGPRMQQAFREAFDEGYERAAIVGTDHPTLPSAYVRRSFEALDDPQSICIGPSEDGGFYLLGMSAFYPQLFGGMTYSHEDVFTDTLARAGTTDAQLAVLPEWYDVDTPVALRRLIGDLKETDGEAPRTRAMIDRLSLRDRMA